MAYFLEMGLSRGEGLYLEIAFRNNNAPRCAPALVAGDGIDHQMLIGRRYDDYGLGQEAGQLLASNSNGLIVVPAPGIIAINVPPDVLWGLCGGLYGIEGWGDYGLWEGRRNEVGFRINAVPANPDFTKTLFIGTLSFGDRAMNPYRITAGVSPLYPNASSAYASPQVQVSQIKMQLAATGQLDAVEAALGAPTSPATLQWTSGGFLTAAGPLANLIAAALGFNAASMAALLTSAAALPA